VRSRTWVALAGLLVVGAGCTPMDNLIVSVFGRSMRDQNSILPYQNPRGPVEGTVSFASGNFPTSPGAIGYEGAEGTAMPEPITPLMVLMATAEPQSYPQVTGLQNPIASDAASLARGEELYLRACAPCHGGGGAGDGTVTAAGIPRWTLLSPEARGYSDGYLYSIIRVGRGAMPAYGHQLAHFDRWHVVNYVRQLQGLSAAPAAAPAPTESEGDDSDA
jgi:mono/diheme cytochrome c family protein